MTIEEAVQALRAMYNDPTMKKSTAVHLFGVRYAERLHGMPLKEIAIRAGISENYHTEIRKGMNLAEYVQER